LKASRPMALRMAAFCAVYSKKKNSWLRKKPIWNWLRGVRRIVLESL
jgi:hypothetical protein